MTPLTVTVDRKAEKDLRKIPTQYQRRIVTHIKQLRIDPDVGKALKGELKGTFSLRVWPYRIIYTYYPSEKLIEAHDIEHRKDVYR